MRQGFVFSIIATIFLCAPVFGVGGDMGGADPNGSPEKPYLIEDIDDFDEFASNSAYWASGVHTKLMTDIDLLGRTYTTAVIAPSGGNSYEGVFDGNSHTIGNLTIDTAGLNNDYLGLFGKIKSNSIIRNLNIINATVEGNTYSSYVSGICSYNDFGKIINCSSDGEFTGYSQIAGICGFNYGTIDDCYANGTVRGKTGIGGICGISRGDIINSYSSANIDGVRDPQDIGGICGRNVFGNITACNADGTIEGDHYTGGVCGFNNEGIISSCSSNCSVSGKSRTGGICGYTDEGAIINCHSGGFINGETTYGGILGVGYYGNIRECFSTARVEGGGSGGGLCGSNYGGHIDNCYFSGFIQGTDRIGGLCGSGSPAALHINNCYASGVVYGSNVVGGLCGDGGGTQFENCYSICNVYGTSFVGGFCGDHYFTVTSGNYFLDTGGPDNGYGTPLDDPNMMIQSNFVGWDFDPDDGDPADWMMLRKGEDYPRLAWQEIFTGDIAGLYGIDIIDFAYLSQYWGLDDCNGVDDCGRADIDGSGDVELLDLVSVVEDWLQGVNS